MSYSDSIFELLRELSTDKGAMASLRSLLSNTQKYRGWSYIGKINGIGDICVETIAGLYALHPMECNKEHYNFGDACKKLAQKRSSSSSSDDSPFDRRFRRLLACSSREELCALLPEVIRGMKAEEIAVNYESLYEDIRRWNAKQAENWASHYWSSKQKDENVSD